jgi:hypothetical protein
MSALAPRLNLPSAAGRPDAMGAGTAPTDPTGVMQLGVPFAVTAAVPAPVPAADASAASWLKDSRSCCAMVWPAAAVADAMGCITRSVRCAVDMSRLGVAGAAGGRAPLAAASRGGVAIPERTGGVPICCEWLTVNRCYNHTPQVGTSCRQLEFPRHLRDAPLHQAAQPMGICTVQAQSIHRPMHSKQHSLPPRLQPHSPDRMPSEKASPSVCRDPLLARLPPPKPILAMHGHCTIQCPVESTATSLHSPPHTHVFFNPHTHTHTHTHTNTATAITVSAHSPDRMPSEKASPSVCRDPLLARLPPPKKPPGPGLNMPPPAAAAAAVGVAMPEAEWGEATPLIVVRLPMRGMVEPKSWWLGVLCGGKGAGGGGAGGRWGGAGSEESHEGGGLTQQQQQIRHQG